MKKWVHEQLAGHDGVLTNIAHSGYFHHLVGSNQRRPEDKWCANKLCERKEIGVLIAWVGADVVSEELVAWKRAKCWSMQMMKIQWRLLQRIHKRSQNLLLRLSQVNTDAGQPSLAGGAYNPDKVNFNIFTADCADSTTLYSNLIHT